MSDLPPGPRSPAVWQLVQYSLWPLEFLEGCARRYGDPFTIRQAGYGSLVMLASPDAVKDVFRGDPHVLHSGEGNEFLSVSAGKNSVLVLDDEPHERQRRVLVPALKGERMRAFFTAMQQATLAEIQQWPLERPFRAEQSMRQITARVILQAVLGWEVGPQLVETEGKVHRLMAAGRSRLALILMKVFSPERFKPSRRVPFYRALWELDAVVYEAIRSGREQVSSGHPDCVLTDLLAASHEDGRPLSNEEVRDAVVTLLFAGHETTSVALAWAVGEIAAREDVMGEIRHEIHKLAGDELPREEHLPLLTYLDATIREVLRLRTVLPFVVRLTKQPFVAGGREYPPGVLLAPCLHLVHRRPDLYPEPERLKPERFLERKFTPYEWFPFGGANRICLGMPFAMFEMKVVLATLLATCRLARPTHSTQYVRRGLTLAPKDGCRIALAERRGLGQT